MTYTDKYIKRLLKFAHHLVSGRLFEHYVPMVPPAGRGLDQPPVFQTEDGIEFSYFTFITDELPFLFPKDFASDKSGKPYLISGPKLDPHEAFAFFMGLSPQEFLHLAAPNSQRRELGGTVLAYNAAPADIGQQIFQLLGTHTKMN